MKYLGLLLFCPCVIFAITIQKAEVVGDGSDENRPLVEGNELQLTCQADSEWSFCQWSHELEDQKDSNGNYMKLLCDFSSTHAGDACSNVGGSDEMDNAAGRIRLVASTNVCGIRISKSEAIDGGEWKCGMSVGDITSAAWAFSEVDAFVSNQSTIAITEPDLFQDPNEVISYEIDRTNTEIEATCTGYGGNPEPTFHWYIDDDDDDNEITDHDTRKIGPSNDPELGDYISEQMTWSPSRDDLCEFDATDSCDDDQFTFNLICKVEQTTSSGTYYQYENNQKMAEVMVEVTSSSTTVLSSLFLISLALMTVLH